MIESWFETASVTLLVLALMMLLLWIMTFLSDSIGFFVLDSRLGCRWREFETASLGIFCLTR